MMDQGTVASRGYRSMEAGLAWETPPMRLYRKWAEFGTWSPWQFDLAQDRRDWGELDGAEHTAIATLTGQFLAGEEAVTLDILPLVNAIQAEGRNEETLFLSTFASDEAKHTTFFRRYFDEAVPGGPPEEALTPSYQTVFGRMLPEAMAALRTDRSPEAITRAATTYNLFVEGVLAETAYWSYETTLEEDDLLPGLREGITHIQRDESRHIAYGIFLLSRLMVEDEDLWDVVESTMDDLFQHVPGIVQENWELYEESPFSLEPEDVVDYATEQFELRMARVEKARGRSLEEVYKVSEDVARELEERAGAPGT